MEQNLEIKTKEYPDAHFLLEYMTADGARMRENTDHVPGLEIMDSWGMAVMIEAVQPFFDTASDLIRGELFGELHRDLYYLNLNPHQSVVFFPHDFVDYELIARQIYYFLKRKYTARLYLSVSRSFHGIAELPGV